MKAFTKESYFEGGYQVSERIYVLKHPDNQQIFYIGRTRKPLCDRLHGHIQAAKGKHDKFTNSIKDEYIRGILATGKKPLIETVEKITPISYIEFLEIAEREIHWMKHFKERGCMVMNIIGLKVPQPNAKYLWYLDCKEKRSVPAEYYFCGRDRSGNALYHKERVLTDGLQWIDDPPPTPPTPKYNPFLNQRWRMKVGLDSI